GQNGVDILTRSLVQVAERDVGNYLAILGTMLVVYAAVLVILRRRGRFDPRAFVPMLAESALYALTMGSIILFVMNRLIGVLPGLSVGGAGSPADVLVISAGAGFHEELVFRVLIMGGLAWLLTGVTGKKRAWLIALVASSIVFSLAHHIGPAGEAFTFGAFVYRMLAGAFFAIVYQVRGFAVAAWTHALYDVFVLSIAH
ncbi:MAG TPA: CPBP family intramembrane glutamic endopeptidase, partial [Nannocystaceae bacterium]|nr:CPBP family intramembrane glutamic endopeptidase [Nannocystaceae bacterium]